MSWQLLVCSGSIATNVWCYVVVLMQHSTCYLLVRFITTELELERKRFFFSFLCGGNINLKN